MMDLSGIMIDMSDFIQIAAFLVSALVGYWGVCKAMTLLGGSPGRDRSVYYNHDGSFEYHSDLKARRARWDV